MPTTIIYWSLSNELYPKHPRGAINISCSERFWDKWKREMVSVGNNEEHIDKMIQNYGHFLYGRFTITVDLEQKEDWKVIE